MDYETQKFITDSYLVLASGGTSFRVSSSRETGESLIVQGLLSVEVVDLHGQLISLDNYDPASYLKNPILFVNHRPFVDANGNEKSAGLVLDLVKARLVGTMDGRNGYAVVSTGSAVEVDFIPASEFRTGVDLNNVQVLWISARVDEPDVIKAVKEKKLNSFSWRGLLTGTKKHASLRHIVEASLVNVPANTEAVSRVVYKSLNDFEPEELTTEIEMTPEEIKSLVEETVKSAMAAYGEQNKPHMKELSDAVTTTAEQIRSLMEKEKAALASEPEKKEDNLEATKGLIQTSLDAHKKEVLAQIQQASTSVAGLVERFAVIEKSFTQSTPRVEDTKTAKSDPEDKKKAIHSKFNSIFGA
jgi:Icc-related predicted phosphoesterase